MSMNVLKERGRGGVGGERKGQNKAIRSKINDENF